MQSQRDLAKVTSERYTRLVARGAVAIQDADTQQANFRTADALVSAQEANVHAAEDNVRQSQANLDRVLALQDYKNVRAPFEGIVTARNVEIGSLIAANGGGSFVVRDFPAARKRIDIGDYYAEDGLFRSLTGWAPRTDLRSGPGRRRPWLASAAAWLPCNAHPAPVAPRGRQASPERSLKQ